MKNINKLAIIILASLIITHPGFSRALRGVRASTPAKDATGDVVEVELSNPYDEFDILDEEIFVSEQLSEIPGRIIAVVEDKNGKLIYLPYVDDVLRDSVGIPKIEPAEFKYDYYLLDVRSAAQVGVGLSGIGVDASASSNYRVEYTFYQGAVSRIGNRDIDQTKFDAAIPRIAKALAESESEYKVRGYRVVMAAVTLHSAYALLTGVDSQANVSGLGWKVGGKFYASQKMEKNRMKVGLTLRRIAPAPMFASTINEVDIRKMLGAAGESAATAVEVSETAGLNLDSSRFPVAFSIKGIASEL